MIELLDNIFRYGAVFCSLLVAALAVRDARAQLAGRLAALCCVFTACFLIASDPNASKTLGLVMVPIKFFGMATPVILWLFSLSMFDDSFKLKPVHWIAGSMFWLSSLAMFVEYYLIFETWPALTPAEFNHALNESGAWFPFSRTIADGTKIGMIGHMLYSVWGGRDDDLLEARRWFRTAFVVAGAAVTFIVIYSIGAAADLDASFVQLVDMVQSGAILAIILFLLWNVTRIDSEWLLGNLNEQSPVKPTKVTDPSDALDLERLRKLATETTLLEQGLTMSRLSEITRMPEHRLRRLINQHMGFRNFSDFLNHHRIAAAKNRLCDTDERHTPVLTIAMDLGYGSLGPFNRAFKARTGKTPTEFRREALKGA